MRFHIICLTVGLYAMFLTGCSDDKDVFPQRSEIEFTWETGNEGWEFGYADYPAGLTESDSLSLYAMSYGHRTLPDEIQPSQKGLYIAGANRSDDLFMFLSAPIEGLAPGDNYEITFELSLASNAPTNAVGIGGAPGESVFIKAGAVASQPGLVVDDGWYRMSLDKGNQSTGGEDMIVLGNAGVADDTQQYEVVNRTNKAPFIARAGNDGRLWLVLGSDSGFEGYTALYYAGLKVKLVRI